MKSACALAFALTGCTATFIGDRAYHSAPPPPAAPAVTTEPRAFRVVAETKPELVVLTEPVEAAKQRFHELSPRRPIVGESRPRPFASLPAVRMAPPILSTGGPGWPGGKQAWVSLKQGTSTALLTVFPALTAEVMIGDSRFYTAGPVPGAEMRGPPVLWNKVRSCNSDEAATTVRWNGFLVETRTQQSLDYFEMSGLLSPERCRAEANEVRSARAAAVLPGVVYAARRCADDDCLGAAPQSIVLIAPPATWMPSTTALPKELLVPHTGSFSRAEISIRRGEAGSAQFTVDAEHIERFRRAKNPITFIGAKTIAISVDVIWPSAADEPTFTVQLAAADTAQTFAAQAQRLLRPTPTSFPDPREPQPRRRR
jgi:hypothetical protein